MPPACAKLDQAGEVQRVRRTALHEAHQVGVDLIQPTQSFVGRRYDASFPRNSSCDMEHLRVPEYRRVYGSSDDARLATSLFIRMLSARSVQATSRSILLNPASLSRTRSELAHARFSRSAGDHLAVRPALPSSPTWALPITSSRMNQLQVRDQAGQPRHTCRALLLLILERQNSLLHNK